MKTIGNTILITGGNSGIGRALAEAFHALGNQVIISGRNEATLSEVTEANPGMKSIVMDMSSSESVQAFAETARRTFPAINVLINNAGIMKAEDLAAAPDYLTIAEETITTNLLGPIRLTAALLPHLKQQDDAAVLTVSSGLAFVPMAATPTYSATKAAIHSYSMSLRHQLKGAVEIIEIIPPYVQTQLMGERQANDPNAMPLADFISEVMEILSSQSAVEEVIVGRCKPLRFAAEDGRMDTMYKAINAMHH